MTAKNLKDQAVPDHVGFIMDGNRRWAKSKGLPVLVGHRNGLEALEKIIEPCAKRGIKYLTFFSFSTENWNRSKREVDNLMSLMAEALEKKSKALHQKGARVKIIGRKEDLSKQLQKKIENLEEITKNNTKINIAFAISYGGRFEIIDAVNKIKGKITEKAISENLYAPEFPDPELIIRTGGQKRLSGFLLWQSVYSELYFSDTLWPDFNDVELDKALSFYANVVRNFGK